MNKVLFLLLLLSIHANAQSDKSQNHSGKDTVTVEQKDVNDVVKNLFKKKEKVPSDTIKIKPGKLLFSVVPGVGYTIVTNLTAVATINTSFYAGKTSDTYLSSITTLSEFSLFNHQITIPIESNIWTKRNKFNLLGDWRYYKYPTYTYGLGSHSSLADADLIDYSYIRVYQEALKRLKSDYFAGIGYNFDYHYNIAQKGVGDFQQYNAYATKTVSSGLVLHLLYDGRKNVNTPEAGFYSSVTYRSNFTFMGSDNNWQSLQLDFRKYIKPLSHHNNVLAFWSFNWFTFGGHPPYFDLPSTGWDTYSNIGRGYIQGRLRDANLMYLEAEDRFDITRSGLLGGVVFVNAQTVSEQKADLDLGEVILPGVGGGLRVKVNKFSKINFCIDYGFGTEHSQGFFINLCEIF